MSLYKEKSEIDKIGVFTNKKIPKGKRFYKIDSKLFFEKPFQRCAKIGEDKYVSDEKVLNYVNHSCNPNAKLDLQNLKLISLKDIQEGEEITVNYEHTEKKINKIVCNCKSENCNGYFYKGE